MCLPAFEASLAAQIRILYDSGSASEYSTYSVRTEVQWNCHVTLELQLNVELSDRLYETGST